MSEDSLRILSRTVDAVQQGGVPNHATLSEAVQKAGTGEIGVFLNLREREHHEQGAHHHSVHSGAHHRARSTKPAVDISTPDTIIVIGLDTVGGSAGWLLQTGHELRGVRAQGQRSAGIQIAGNGNRVSWNAGTTTASASTVSGTGNDLRGGTMRGAHGDGVRFSPTAQDNMLRGSESTSMAATGSSWRARAIRFATIRAWTATERMGWWCSGSGNTIKGNVVGSAKTQGNGEHGFAVTGAGNTLDSNKASTNLGDGFDISGGIAGNPNVLRGNQSNLGTSGGPRENMGAEYRLTNA